MAWTGYLRGFSSFYHRVIGEYLSFRAVLYTWQANISNQPGYNMIVCSDIKGQKRQGFLGQMALDSLVYILGGERRHCFRRNRGQRGFSGNEQIRVGVCVYERRME